MSPRVDEEKRKEVGELAKVLRLPICCTQLGLTHFLRFYDGFLKVLGACACSSSQKRAACMKAAHLLFAFKSVFRGY